MYTSRNVTVKSCWEATNYSGSQEKCKKRLTELYGEDWDEHVKFKDHFKSLKYYYIWALLISHRQQWNELKSKLVFEQIVSSNGSTTIRGLGRYLRYDKLCTTQRP